MMRNILSFLIVSLVLLTSCEYNKNQYLGSYGQPEGLIDTSNELVTVILDNPRAMDEVVEWIGHEQPTRAELVCGNYTTDLDCKRAVDTLDLFAVPVDVNPDTDYVGEKKLVLYYERIVVRDCDNYAVSNHNNFENKHMATWGCSNAVNMLQMVADKEQYTNPEISDEQDSAKAVAVYNDYQETSSSQKCKCKHQKEDKSHDKIKCGCKF